METRPKLLRNIAFRAGMSVPEVMAAAHDLEIPFHMVLGDWLLDTDNATARAFADHLCDQGHS